MDIVVQPAVNWMDLNEQIKDTGLFLPLDPGPMVCHSHEPQISESCYLCSKKFRLTLEGWSPQIAGISHVYTYIESVLTIHSGTNAMRYGTMKDWVINLTVVLADGTVIKTRRRPRYALISTNLVRRVHSNNFEGKLLQDTT